MEERQNLILHRLSRVRTFLSTLWGFVSDVRHSLQQQNDLLHRVELHIDNINDKYLVGLYVTFLPWTGPDYLPVMTTARDSSLVMDFCLVALYHMYDSDSFLGSLY